jgi:hypothetical protein
MDEQPPSPAQRRPALVQSICNEAAPSLEKAM